MKNLSILGSTGSIGCNVLEIAGMFPDRFSVIALTGGTNIDLLASQIKKFRPKVASVLTRDLADKLSERIPSDIKTEIVFGSEGYIRAATLEGIDVVVSSIVGSAGLLPTIAAIEKGYDIALANKETLVMAGEYVMNLASSKGVSILPVDSEHSAIFQCLQGQREEDFDRIHLTASGGPFRSKPVSEFKDITTEDALSHPTWSMGKKISIDSATLMNKGLEVIEAVHLFNVSHKQIEVIIHPQSIVHSMVSFIDGSVIAQLGVPDMKGAIAYAITYPERMPIKQPVPDFAKLSNLTFESPDTEKFPCLKLAFEAIKTGETMPCVMNAANEVAVAAFLDRKISFMDIAGVINKTMEKHNLIKSPNLEDIISADDWARKICQEFTN
ncbi:MAG: 1-deoxy-D-xylulose-5-phosphate reductoisomerase [Deltaproteobacteria bacterium]|nr:1-deoxy-D-xylulose-5-phosphate reductoisomerase [Deltaproteobacteria bacterium]